MALKQASFFPLLSVVFALLAFFIGYAIAVAKEHVDPFLPYISDCGNLPPESNIFGELLNLSSFLLMVTVYLIHRNLVVTYEKVEHKHLGKWKIFSFCLMLLGIASAVGASIVANFQEGVQLATHDTGAFLFFIGITIYFWGQVLIGFALRPKTVNLCLTIFRCLLCIAITTFLIFHMTCLFANPFIEKDANGKRPVKPPTPPDGIEKYSKGSPFYWNHIATTLSEWILALLLETFVLTFVFELAYTSLEAPTVKPHDPLRTDDPDRTFYTNQVAPMEPMLQPVQPLEVPTMRRLPRIDIPYGTYSRKGTDDISYSAYKTGKDEVVFGTYSRTGKEVQESAPLNGVSKGPYERNHVMSGYNQYQYF